ncbi:MAG: outer membrane beta-barrel protein [candidate division Zixibacteria bacterium]|nr:outer membrane beta-barrel protein [candidate division Zixibacteria bacterium]
MKLVIYSLVLALALLSTSTLAADGPIDRGSLVNSSELFVRHDAGDVNKQATTIQIVPAISYFFAPGLALGTELYYQNISIDEENLSSWGIGATAGYYLNSSPSRSEVKGAIYPYIVVFGGLGQTTRKNRTVYTYSGGISYSSLAKQDYDTQHYGVQVGAVHMMSQAIGLDISIRYQKIREKVDGTENWVTGSQLMAGAGIKAFIW